MQLLRSVGFITYSCTVLMIGSRTVFSQNNFPECGDPVKLAVAAGSLCGGVKIYTKCVIKTLGLHTRPLSDPGLQFAQDYYDAEAAKLGVSICPMNIVALVEEIQQDELKDKVKVTPKPYTKSFETSQTLEDCLLALTEAGSRVGGITCSQAREHSRCAMRVTNFVREGLTSQEIQEFKTTIEDALLSQGVACNLDIQALIDEMKGGQSGDVTSKPTPTTATTTTTTTITTTTTTTPTTATTSSTISTSTTTSCNTRVSASTPTTTWVLDLAGLEFDQCLEENSVDQDNLCSRIKEEIKCVLRHSTKDDQLTESQRTQIQNYYSHQISQDTNNNTGCDFHLNSLADEVRGEKNGASRELLPLHALTMVFVAKLAILTKFIL